MKKTINKSVKYIKKYGLPSLTKMIVKRTPTYLNNYFNSKIGLNFSKIYRKTKNYFINLLPIKKPTLKFKTLNYGLSFPDTESYRKELKFYLRKKQTFEEYADDKNNPKKEYINLKIGAYFQVFNKKKATFETLKSFRKYYPDSPIYLLSDKGENFSEIAKNFNCDYKYSEENIAYWPCKNILGWFARLNKVCEKYSDCDWILLLEDDVRVRDKISKMPRGHMVGQGGGNNLKKGKQISAEAKKYLWNLFPGLEINGISGCGASIFNRKSFMECYKNIKEYNIDELKKLDNGLSWATDFSLTFLFLMNGMLVRRWLDHSEEFTKNFGPASAFDHQYKKYYNNLSKYLF